MGRTKDALIDGGAKQGRSRSSKTMFTGYTVSIKGLDSLMLWLKDSNPKLHKALRKGLKESMTPVLQKSRANARRIQDDGTYAGSLSVGTRANGSQFVLKAIDQNAGVKEFARPGAVGRHGEWVGKHVGVPRRANQPRVMVSAVADSSDEIRDRIEARIAEVLKEVERL